ncbi:MAG: FG-GAP-like repeat-containing protein [Flavobacteriaceae bacterium]|nr:FG-GAP-like repeat-containing protein [Flavobacteriaceae bacterium]
MTLSVTSGDLNQDGWPDLYVSNDFSTPDYFYLNNKNGTFSEHVKDVFKQIAFYGMGADLADFNNDQLLDLVQLEMMAKDHRRAKANMASMNTSLFWNTVNSGFHYQYMHNMLQMNNGVINDSLPDFSNISKMAGMASTDWSWGALMADLDNDGWKDLYITNGTRREINNRDYFNKIGREYLTKDSMLAKSLAIPSEPIDNFVYKIRATSTFEHANEKWGMVSKGFSNGCTYADLDNDGDLEVIINNIDEEVTVFKNNNTDNKYLAMRFAGPDKNKFGLGVKVTLVHDTVTQFQELTLTRGFQSAVPPQMHFGLAKADKIDRVEVVWPNGAMQVLQWPTNQMLTLNFTEAKDVFKAADKEPAIFYTEKNESIALKHKHSENSYNDFEKEILLPYRTSALGPALAVGDLNQDGLDDFIVGGAAQYEAGVYFQTAGGFQKQDIATLQKDNPV